MDYDLDENSRLKLESGILIAVPIPKDKSANASKIQTAIDQSLKEAMYVKIRMVGSTVCLINSCYIYIF